MIAIKYLRNEVIDYREFKDTYEFAKWLVDQCKLEDIVIKDIENIEESSKDSSFCPIRHIYKFVPLKRTCKSLLIREYNVFYYEEINTLRRYILW